MKSSRHVRLLVLAFAWAASSAAHGQPALETLEFSPEKPVLKHVFLDTFGQDSRSDYLISRKVNWEQGRLTFNDRGSAAGKPIETGPYCEWEFEIVPPVLEKDGDQAALLLRIQFDGATETCVAWAWMRTDGKTTGKVDILDTQPGLVQVQLFLARSFPIPDDDGSWRIRYRYGLISLNKGDLLLGTGFVNKGNSPPVGWSLLSQSQFPMQVSRVGVKNSALLSGRLPKPTAQQSRVFAHLEALLRSATVLVKQGRYAEAEPVCLKMLETCEMDLGADHQVTATVRHNIGVVYDAIGAFDKSEKQLLAALEWRHRALGSGHPECASTLVALTSLYKNRNAFEKAEHCGNVGFNMTRIIHGEDHPEHAKSLTALGLLYSDQGLHAKAFPLLRQACEILRLVQGNDHPEYAQQLVNLSNVCVQTGRYAEAEALLLDARRSLLNSAGPAHYYVAVVQGNLAQLYAQTGRFTEAEKLLLDVRTNIERAPGKNHPEYAKCLADLANVYCAMGAFTRAEPLYVEACDVVKRIVGDRHPKYATMLHNQATMYAKLRQFSKAETALLTAADVWKTALGPEHPSYASALLSLADVYRITSAFEKAETLSREALSITEKHLGKRHPAYAACVHNLAAVCGDLGLFDQADQLFNEAYELRREILGELHPQTVDSLGSIAILHERAGRLGQAEETFRRVLARESEFSRKLMSGLPESRSVEVLQQTVRTLEHLLSVSRNSANRSDFRAYSDVWTSRGMAGRLMRERRAAVMDVPEARKIRGQLRLTQQELAQWTLMSLPPEQQPLRQRRLQELNDFKEKQESDLARLASEQGAGGPSTPVEVVDLLRALPPDTAVVHLLKMQMLDGTLLPNGKPDSSDQYEAFVLRRIPDDRPRDATRLNDFVTWVHLGEAEPIDQAIREWRKSIQPGDASSVPKGADLAGLTAAKVIRDLVWSPIRAELGNAHRVIFIADGDLHFVPWAALPGEKPGTLLIEDFAFATVHDGVQLFELLKQSAVEGNSLLLVGGVSYDEGEARPVVEVTSTERGVGGTRLHFDSQRPLWDPLKGTRDEIQLLARVAGKDRSTLVLSDSDAREVNLRLEMPKARFIHLATHGFFADEAFRSAWLPEIRGERLFGGDEHQLTKSTSEVTQRNPYLLSGIVLAGANQPPQIDALGMQTGQDGILTAEEVVNLDLRRTELVVLSACETGLGRVAGGEGVFGLQRAFGLAGARTTVASMWKVDDAATQILMVEFYRNLWEKKLGKLESLRQAQLTMIRRYDPKSNQLGNPDPARKPLPPVYWAAFSLSGDWR